MEEVKRLYAEGASLLKIARKAGVTHRTITERLKMHGIRIRGRREALQIVWHPLIKLPKMEFCGPYLLALPSPAKLLLLSAPKKISQPLNATLFVPDDLALFKKWSDAECPKWPVELMADAFRAWEERKVSGSFAKHEKFCANYTRWVLQSVAPSRL